jgi:hypothetical protein
VFYPHAFEAPIERHGVGRSRVLWYKVLFLPPQLQAELPFDRHPRLRVEGEVADVPVAGAWMPTGDGRAYFIVSPKVLKAAEVGLGDPVEMRFRIDEQDRVDVPEALAEALSREPTLQAVWDELSAGRRRGLTHLVHAARTPETERRRVAAVLDDLRTGDRTQGSADPVDAALSHRGPNHAGGIDAGHAPASRHLEHQLRPPARRAGGPLHRRACAGRDLPAGD